MNKGYTYIMSNINHTTIYIGVTSELERRVFEHKTGIGSTFTTKYNCTDLLYFEKFPLITQAIAREKQLKNWKSEWKWALVKEQNPWLKDLAADWFDRDEVIRAFRDNHPDYEGP